MSRSRPRGAPSSSSGPFALPGLSPGVAVMRERWSRASSEGGGADDPESTAKSVWAHSTSLDEAQVTSSGSADRTQLPSPAKRPRTSSSTKTLHRRHSEQSTTAKSTAGARISSSHSHTRPTTSASVAGADGSWICAVLESRGTGREVGIAMLEQTTGHCLLTQFADTQTYVRTIHHLATHPPVAILVPSPASSNALAERQALSKQILVQCLEEAFGIEVVGMARGAWNHDEGARYLDRLLVDRRDSSKSSSEDRDGDSGEARDITTVSNRSELGAEIRTRAAILTATTGRYYALSACAALFQYLESTANQAYSHRSLSIRYLPAEGTIMIHHETARDLELVLNALNRQSKDSLFGLLNLCVTPMGQRLLRMNILQPLRDQDTIEGRLDAIEELLATESLSLSLSGALKPLARHTPKIDLDKLIHQLLSPHKRYDFANPAEVESKITQILSLRTVICAALPARATLEGAHSELLRIVESFLEERELEDIVELIGDCMNEDIVTAKSTGRGQKDVRVWAVREEHCPLVAVARQTYKENIGDILTLIQQLGNEHQLPLVPRIVNEAYYIEVSSKDVDATDLPECFTGVSRTKGGKALSMTTIELKKLNQRLKDSHNEVFLLSVKRIEELRQKLIERVGILYKASEALAILDMLWALAQSARAHGWSRPEFGERLTIKAGRHPILDARLHQGAIPNDTLDGGGANFFLITGPNMAGKTTYLHQVALLQIMASVGSYVPAERAVLRSGADCILARLSNRDDMEQNLSTFGTEMRATAFVLELATERSIVIIDELGRGTSTIEGFSVAHAVCERLISSKATVLFATHFLSLARSLSAFPSVTARRLLGFAGGEGDEEQRSMQEPDHRLLHGVTEDSHYGLTTASLCGLPSSLLSTARDISTALSASPATRRAHSALKRRHLVLKLVSDLDYVLRHSELDEVGLRRFLGALQRDFVERVGRCYEEEEGLVGERGRER